MAEEKKEKKQKKKKKHRFFWFIVKFQILLMFVVMGAFFYYHYSGYAEVIQNLRKEAIVEVRESNEKTFLPSQTSIVYDTNGTLISYVKGEKESDYVEYRDIPLDFVRAMVSIEDKKFYEHKGVDYMAIIRSAKAILESGELTQGGSTITMQLSRNIYLHNGKSWERKVKEIFIALELEKRYSKNKIMEFYLNNIYFANGYYGIQSACKGYFSCELNELSLSQIAFLCAIPNSPSYYDPIVHFDNTITRRNRILKNMYEDEIIDEYTYKQAFDEEIELNPTQTAKSKRNNYIDTYAYYCATRALMQQQGFVFQEYFSSEVEKQLYYERYDALYAECQKKIYAEGYQIYTSIDLTKQEELQSIVNSVLSEFTDTNEEGIFQMQGSAVCIDNRTGYVIAIVGGREQDIGIYTLNRAYQSHRQPGSSIKPLIVYTPFFEQGNQPETMVVDQEIENGPSASYYYGEITTRFAVEKSLNPVAWQLYEQLTPQVGLAYLKNMHFSAIKEADYVPATALGGFTQGVSAVEMAAAYATLQNDGKYRTPTCIKKITDSEGTLVYLSSPQETQIYKETAARMMTDVLTGVMERGTGTEAKLTEMPCAGKTGTTNDSKDGWFVGYTRYYTTSVWVGCDIPKTIEGLQGGTYPAEIWKNYMETIHQGLAPLNFLPYAQLSQEFIEEYYPPEETETEMSQEENPNSEDNSEDLNNSENLDNSEESDNFEDDNIGADTNNSENENTGDNTNNSENENTGEDINNSENIESEENETPPNSENSESENTGDNTNNSQQGEIEGNTNNSQNGVGGDTPIF
ncbi:MAG: PBP1A family penicillin-binding protein [Lachnospiraceae bacterium]|nr:PBP1A family penicillin-binding protein [Lachnospiraceae bacterium]